MRDANSIINPKYEHCVGIVCSCTFIYSLQCVVSRVCHILFLLCRTHCKVHIPVFVKNMIRAATELSVFMSMFAGKNVLMMGRFASRNYIIESMYMIIKLIKSYGKGLRQESSKI